VAAQLAELGWECEPALVARLAAQLRAAEQAGVVGLEATWPQYARACHQIAEADVASVPADLDGAVRQVVVGTLLTDPVLATLRRLAQQAVSEARVSPRGATPALHQT
jgi:hypothetical protein